MTLPQCGRWAALIPLTVGLWACEASPNFVPVHNAVASVRLDPLLDSLVIGETVALKATPLDLEGNPTISDKNPVWTALNPLVANVDTLGNVHALLPGQASIRVIIDGREATATIVVRPAPVVSVTVIPARASREQGDTIQFVAQAINTLSIPTTSFPVSWSVSDSTRLRIDSTGRAVTLGVGTVTVSATVDGIQGSTTATVLVPVASISVTLDTASVAYDDTALLQVTARDAGGNPITDRSAAYVTSPPGALGISVSALSLTGVTTVRGLTPGRGTLVVSSGRVSDTVVVTVASLVLRTVTTGGTFTCGLGVDSAAYCWGYGEAGALGTGDLNDGPRPRRVVGALKFAALSAGSGHACGLSAGGQAYCWGRNDNGELGSNAGQACIPQSSAVQCSPTPVLVSGGLTFASLVAGDAETCGVSTGGTAYCWGGTWGPMPFPAAGALTFTSVLSSYDISPEDDCGLASDSTVYCWNSQDATPFQYEPSTHLTALSRGALMCGLTAAGELYCWGLLARDAFNWSGLGFTHMFPSLSFRSAAPGTNHLCGITTTGATVCWGLNANGQLGNGSTTDDFGDSVVTALPPVPLVFIQAGGAHTCGMGADGRAYCWGLGTFGELGLLSTQNATTPQGVMNQQ